MILLDCVYLILSIHNIIQYMYLQKRKILIATKNHVSVIALQVFAQPHNNVQNVHQWCIHK